MLANYTHTHTHTERERHTHTHRDTHTIPFLLFIYLFGFRWRRKRALSVGPCSILHPSPSSLVGADRHISSHQLIIQSRQSINQSILIGDCESSIKSMRSIKADQLEALNGAELRLKDSIESPPINDY